ncbi:hypothetical protein [Runella sp.]|jgi:hypothetical protein|uniref:hypothetical protein n=1 Tax=Runella sp. TaxID=1960881 RepID=UPI00262BB6F6|nr:hypothetical protein [Runella sp.]
METGKPISSFGGMIEIGGGFCSLGAYSSENELKKIAQEDEKEVLKVNPSLKNAKFRLNDNPAFLADIEDISPEKFIKAVKYEVYDSKKAVSEIYMLVYTKQ